MILLLIGLGASALVADHWLVRESTRLRASLVDEMTRRFDTAVAQLGLGAGNEPDFSGIEDLLGVKVLPVTTPTEEGGATLSFPHSVSWHSQSREVSLQFPTPPAARMIIADRGLIVSALLLGPLAAALLAAAFLFRFDRGTRIPWPAAGPARREMESLEHLARSTVERGEALERERAVRRRAEEDVALKQEMLTHALEEKVRLGQDLHDGIIQSLYAVGLTLESVRSLGPGDEPERDKRLAMCRDGLNRTIRDVRSYIEGMAPANLRETGFHRAIEELAAEYQLGNKVAIELLAEPGAAAALSEEQGAQAFQVVREALSNAIRHGKSDRVAVRLAIDEDRIALTIEDNGLGFDPDGASAGHGLENMRARSRHLGGNLVVDSRPGHGCRLELRFPIEATG
jgi:signal transduction histidine kinase